MKRTFNILALATILALIVNALAIPVAPARAAGPQVAKWSLNGNYNDSSINGYNGTLFQSGGFPAYSADVPPGGGSNSLQFDGVQFRYGRANLGNEIQGNHTFTVSFWMKYIPTPGQRQWAIWMGNPYGVGSPDGGIHWLIDGNGQANIGVYNGGGNTSFTFTPYANQWVKVTTVYYASASRFSTYVNGVLMDTDTANSANLPASTPVMLGYGLNNFISGGDRYFTGYLDEVEIYDCVYNVTVFNTNDSGIDSLRQALADVCDGGLITIDASLAGQTLTLTSGELTIAKNVIIDGSAAPDFTVSGNNALRVFNISNGYTVTLNNLTIANGLASGGNGGGILNLGTLSVLNSTVSGNSAGSGGGIYNDSSGMMTVTDSTFSGNVVTSWGGGLQNYGTMTITNSTFSGNSAGGGAGLHNAGGTMTVTNSTFSGNSGNWGGGINNWSMLTLTNSTLSGNSAINGGGILNEYVTAALTLKNTIIANSISGGDCVLASSGIVSAASNNLIEDATKACGLINGVNSNIIGVNPLLSSTLANYGGTTQTFPLLPGSPAINAGHAATCAAAPVSGKDQRGINHVGTCDIGAFESRGFDMSKSGGDNQSATVSTAFTNPLEVTVSSSYSEPVDGGKVTFTPNGVTANASITGSPATIPTSGVVTSGVASVTATANGTAGAYTVTASASGATSQNFNLTNLGIYTITASAGANGSVTPSGVTNVNSGGSQSYSITPALGYHVADVLVDGSSVGAVTSYDFTNVTANHTISATFAIDTFTITASAGANGSVTPSDATNVNYNGSQSYTITPDLGYHIVDVLVDGSSVGAVATYDFTNVTANHTISATFAIDTFTITASAGPNGTVTPSGVTNVNYNGSQSYTITPDLGYHIVDVLVDGSSVGAVATYDFTNVTANHTISATFAIDTFTITASAGANGTVTPSGVTNMDYNGSQSYTITPDLGYHIVDVLVDGSSVGAVPTYDFTNVTANHTISATFAVDTYVVTFDPQNGDPTFTQNVNYGDLVVEPPAPTFAGYIFAGWFDAPIGGTQWNFATDTMGADNMTLYAQWASDDHTVTFDPNGGTGTMDPQASNLPAALTLNAFTHTGYTFNGWNTLENGTGTAYADGAFYDFSANLTLYAQWKALGQNTLLLRPDFGGVYVFPYPWKAIGIPAPYTPALDCKVFKSAPCSVVLNGDKQNTLRTIFQMVKLPGKAGDQYSFGLSARTLNIPSGGRIQAEVKFYNLWNKVVGTSVLRLASGTRGWRIYTATATAPADYTHLTFRIVFQEKSGRAWFDDAFLMKLP
ncbi:MAG: InlB B-repeat-containing protein [Chloroflexota bacterium]